MRLLPRSKQQDTINPKSKVYFNLLSVNRRPGRMGIIFSEIEGRTEWFETEFIQQSRRFQDYVLEISVASLNSAPVTERFKLVLLGDVSLTRMS